MKNFIKLIRQAHKEKFSKVLGEVLEKKIPVAFISVAPINQAVAVAKDYRAQDLNITKLFVTDNNPPPRSTLILA